MVETIKMYGFDGYIIPNENEVSRNLLFGEDPLKTFSTAYPIELYMTNTESYGGEQEFFSKFGLEIRNSINVLISKRSFQQRFPQSISSRPREGDLVYVPFTGASGAGELFEIRFVSGNKDFFMLGRKNPYFYELQLEKFKYSQEMVNTGIQAIDRVSNEAYTIKLNLGTGTGNYVYKEMLYQGANLSLSLATAEVGNWDAANNILSVTYIKGEFVAGQPILGATSGASWTIANYDPIEDNQKYEIFDNKIIMNESNTVIVTTESNPLGGI